MWTGGLSSWNKWLKFSVHDLVVAAETIFAWNENIVISQNDDGCQTTAKQCSISKILMSIVHRILEWAQYFLFSTFKADICFGGLAFLY